MNMLRLLSERGIQRFTYYCTSSVAWYDTKTSAHGSAITLLGDNDYEFNTAKFDVKQIVHDGCKVSAIMKQHQTNYLLLTN